MFRFHKNFRRVLGRAYGHVERLSRIQEGHNFISGTVLFLGRNNFKRQYRSCFRNRFLTGQMYLETVLKFIVHLIAGALNKNFHLIHHNAWT